MTRPTVLDVPYFNQFYDYDGTQNPIGGEKMCGAASVVMASGFHGYLGYSDSDNLKKNVYNDQNQALDKSCTVTNYANETLDVDGAFAQTSDEVCDQSYSDGLAKYVGSYSGPIYLAGTALDKDGVKLKINSDKGKLIFSEVVDAIGSSNSPIVTSLNGDGLGHIVLIIGYGVDGLIITNDSYQSLAIDNRGGKYTFNGSSAGYSLDVDGNVNDLYFVSYALTY